MRCVHDFAASIGWEGFTALGTVALAVIGATAVLDAKRQLDDFRKQSRIKHLIDLVDQFEREPMATYRKSLGAQRVDGGILKALDPDEPPSELYDVMNFFEHMGYLLEGNYIDLEDVFVEFHYWIFHVWADARRVIRKEQSEDPIYYGYFAKMVERLESHERQRKGAFALPSVAEIADFYAEEAHVLSGSPIPRQKRLKRRSS
jgi:hypothetical protein